MVTMAIDPSFKHFAFCIYDGDKTIYMDMCSYPLGDSIGFEKVFLACHELWKQVKEKLDAIGVGDKIHIDKVFSEVPPPVGQFSAGLYALDTFMLSKIFLTYDSIKEVYAIPPSYLGTVHGTAKYAKSDSTKLAKYLINEVLSDKFTLVIGDNVSPKGRTTKGTINNDKAESLLFLFRSFCKYDIKGCKEIIGNEMRGFLAEPEKLLAVRSV